MRDVRTKDGRLYSVTPADFDGVELADSFAKMTHMQSLLTGSDALDADGNEDDDYSSTRVKRPPVTLSRFQTLIRERIKAKPQELHVSIEDQESFAAVILGEASETWGNFKNQAPYPFMTVEDNKELRRRMMVYFGDACEQLFNNYIQKAQIVNKRGVFSGPANMSRLSTQLAVDTNKTLNVGAVKRRIAEDMTKNRSGKQQLCSEGRSSNREASATWFKQFPDVKRASERNMLPETGDHSDILSLEEDIEELCKNIPGGSLATVSQLLKDTPPESGPFSKLSDSKHPEASDLVARKSKEFANRAKIPMQRSTSLPHVSEEDLLKELGMQDRDKRTSNVSLPGQNDLLSKSSRLSEDAADNASVEIVETGDVPIGTNQVSELHDTAEDLQRLVRNYDQLPGKGFCVDDDELPPLIQVITQSAKHDDREKRQKQRLLMLEEREERLKQAELIQIKRPDHPQPAVVSAKMANNVMVRASDVRVSDRICLSSLTLEKFSTVYNDLLDEIDAATVKDLDSNLFLGDEITEVYGEITKTIPRDHLLMDNDALIEPAADVVVLVTASTSLKKKRKERIVNPALRSAERSPWGQQTASEWKTKARWKNTGPASSQLKRGTSIRHRQDPAAALDDFCSDEYQMYLLDQETDFLGTVFHLYNSDDGDDSEDEEIRRTREIRQREQDMKLAELKRQKYEYVDGMWNVNTVSMGGLGSMPKAQVEDNDFNSTMAPKPSQTKQRRERTRVTSRRSTRESETGGEEETFASKTTSVLSSSPQDRLEKVWTQLAMPDASKLDMAIKYSSDHYYSMLGEAVVEWEKAAALVLHRESMMHELENFERSASDPNRFFEKGTRGSSVTRLEEAKLRSSLYKRIDAIDMQLRALLEDTQSRFQDCITFHGRPYLEKMQWDRTEMLFWLQEERKKLALAVERSSGDFTSISMNKVQLNPGPDAFMPH